MAEELGAAEPPPAAGSSSPHSGFRRVLRTPQAIAIYVSSVLGSGILVLPGLAARIAGPASLVAWALLAAASVPFAWTFASLSARRPAAGGIYAFARDAFGRELATVTGWLFALWQVVGAPAVALIAASYLAYAFPLDRPESFVLGFALVALAFLINLRGIVLSSRVQVAVLAAIVLLLVAAVAVAGPRVRPSQFTPFLPGGPLSVGVAAALIFWSFLGYENVSNVAEEFADPRRDLPRSVGASLALVGGLYFAVAFVTVGTGAYRAGGGVAPFAALLADVFGPYAAAGTAVLAAGVVFAVLNAYTAGLARVTYATARDGGLPRGLSHLNPVSRVPDRALWALFLGSAVVFGVYYVADVGLTTALLVASGAAIVVYVLGTAAAWRLFRRMRPVPQGLVVTAGVACGISVAVAPFLGIYLAVSLAVGAAAFAFAHFRAR